MKQNTTQFHGACLRNCYLHRIAPTDSRQTQRGEHARCRRYEIAEGQRISVRLVPQLREHAAAADVASCTYYAASGCRDAMLTLPLTCATVRMYARDLQDVCHKTGPRHKAAGCITP